MERTLVKHLNEAFHPAVLFTRADRLDAKIGGVCGNARVHLRIGHAVHHTENFSGGQLQIAVHFGCVVFKRVLQGFPVHRDVTRDARVRV